MNNQEKYLLVVDFPSIKNFVFGTDKLVEIRGGSSLLDHLNREKLPIILSQELGKDNIECVYVGGGAGQFIINASIAKIKFALQKFQALCSNYTGGGLKVNYATQPLQNDYIQAKNKVYKKLRINKEELGQVEASLHFPVTFHTGFIRECDSCSGYAEKQVTHGSETLFLCSTCAAKTRFGQDKRMVLWEELAACLAMQGYDQKTILEAMPQSFEEVGQACQSKQNYTALIYADGNSMGSLVKKIPTQEDFNFFSTQVDQAIRAACHQALAKFCLPASPDQLKLIPALILMLGGDDLMLYLAADKALPVALETARLFEQETKIRFSARPFFKEYLQGQGLTLSIGITFGKHHTPFSILLTQAEELLKSAKLSGAKQAKDLTNNHYTPSFIDFHFSTQFNQISVAQTRKEQLSIENEQESLYLTNKPCSLAHTQILLDQANKLANSSIPKTRLKRLGQLPSFGRFGQVNLEFFNLLSRTKGKTNGQANKTIIWQTLHEFGCRLDEAPWIKCPGGWTTVLSDLVELAEFMPKQ